MTKLKLAPNLTLPLDAATQAIGIVAKRRVGKSYTARKFAEQLYLAGQQIVIVDPKGDWWGIRSAADGKSPGLPVVILGGEHGDLPLDVSNGEVIAKLVTEERVSVLLDLSQFRKREVARFMTDFLENLYRLKAKESLRTPLMLIIDEADAIMPQKPQDGEERMLGAGEDIVRRGGQRGIGCMMITQRTAVLNKNVLTQCEMLIALRTISPQDLKAMQAWIDVHGSIEERDTLMASLPSLPQGDAWFWSPGWPTSDGIFKRVHVDPIETFDSGATPKSGEKRVEPKNLADVDLGALSRQMSETIEKAKADDPKELRKEIAALKKQLAAAPAKTVEKAMPDDRAIARAVQTALREHVAKITYLCRALESAMKFIINVSAANFDVAGIDKVELERAITAATEKATALIDQRLTARAKTIDQLRLNAQRIAAQLKTVLGDEEVVIDVAVAKNEPFSVTKVPATRTPVARTAPAQSIEGVTVPQQKILNALAGFEAMGVAQIDKSIAAVFADQSPTSSGYANNLGRLRSLGLIDYPSGGVLALTDAGRAGATGLDINSVEELHAAWEKQLPRPQWNIVAALIEARPDDVERAVVAEKAEQSATSSGYANNLGRLRSLGLIGYRPGQRIFATDLLFPEGLR